MGKNVILQYYKIFKQYTTPHIYFQLNITLSVNYDRTIIHKQAYSHAQSVTEIYHLTKTEKEIFFSFKI